jgi:hypothetical protein
MYVAGGEEDLQKPPRIFMGSNRRRMAIHGAHVDLSEGEVSVLEIYCKDRPDAISCARNFELEDTIGLD